jgi:hypothetical protein
VPERLRYFSSQTAVCVTPAVFAARVASLPWRSR